MSDSSEPRPPYSKSSSGASFSAASFGSPKKRRLWILLACLASLALAATLVLKALSGDVAFFMTPSQLLAHPPAVSRTVRLGGMVVAHSLKQTSENGTPVATFKVTDGQAATDVRYAGVLPDLFREGQSVVALGHMQGGVFTADEVLAKHDETYMPKEVADALKKSGKWDPRFGPPPNAAQWSAMTRSAMTRDKSADNGSSAFRSP